MEADNKVTLAVLQSDVRHLVGKIEGFHESTLATQQLIGEALERLTAMEVRFDERWKAHWALHKSLRVKGTIADIGNTIAAVIAGIVGVTTK